MRRASDFERLQALIAADAVVLVHDKIARRHRRRFRNNRRRLASFARPCEAIAENVLLREKRNRLSLEAMLQRQYRQRIGAAREFGRFAPRFGAHHALNAVIAQHTGQTLGGAI